MKKLLAMTAAAAMVALPTLTQAQQGGGGGRGGRGNFDPEQMRQRMMDRYKEVLEIKTDDEWKVIEPRIQKITDARREVNSGAMRGMFGGRRPPGGDNQGDQAQNDRRRAFGGEPSAAATAFRSRSIRKIRPKRSKPSSPLTARSTNRSRPISRRPRKI